MRAFGLRGRISAAVRVDHRTGWHTRDAVAQRQYVARLKATPVAQSQAPERNGAAANACCMRSKRRTWRFHRSPSSFRRGTAYPADDDHFARRPATIVVPGPTRATRRRSAPSSITATSISVFVAPSRSAADDARLRGGTFPSREQRARHARATSGRAFGASSAAARVGAVQRLRSRIERAWGLPLCSGRVKRPARSRRALARFRGIRNAPVFRPDRARSAAWRSSGLRAGRAKHSGHAAPPRFVSAGAAACCASGADTRAMRAIRSPSGRRSRRRRLTPASERGASAASSPLR